ncbi:hypothetical protein [Natrarchaeobius chitinivorans]|uniref:Blue (type 1) copper domain-containing protein n=1 Tax=Natrarchaeobius chitinivorans TaxID=1679083 RepID=A0A3N6PCN2_NATCH|nr:hypothetical protein [Natrarchaeobius chitinivorans]RQG94585.1 hypothetical protein EA473_10885 [Natrarchaeobius chitinivorans]
MASSRPTRRTVLAGIAATSAAAVAGCLDRSAERSEDEDDEAIVEAAEATASEGKTDPDAWADVEKIRLDAHVGGWVGAEPDFVDRIENPTLVLLEGREYEIVWENRDGAKHNFALHDDDGEVVDEYATGVVEDVGATERLEFEARPEMTTYICEHQPVIQHGDVVVLEDDESRTDG